MYIGVWILCCVLATIVSDTFSGKEIMKLVFAMLLYLTFVAKQFVEERGVVFN